MSGRTKARRERDRIATQAILNTPRDVVCDYCGKPAILVTGREIHPRRPDLYAKSIYACMGCDAYVGCHPDTTIPLGRLANAELRAAKMVAHAAFDPLWQSKQMKRKDAYLWLSRELGMAFNDCHIGMFDIDQCKRVVQVIALAFLAGGILALSCARTGRSDTDGEAQHRASDDGNPNFPMDQPKE